MVTVGLRTLGDLPLAQRSADRLIADHAIDDEAAYALRLAIEELWPRHLNTPASLEDAPTGGMGLALVAQIAGPLQYSRINGRNRTTLRITRKR